MLTVPTLNPGQPANSPELRRILSPTADDAETPTRDAASAPLTEILDHAVVKDCVTTLHQELEAHFDSLARRSGADIAAIPADADAFLAERIDGQRNPLPPSQRRLFEQSIQPLRAEAGRRAQALYRKKVVQYQGEAIERQNSELLARAVAPENLFDDLVQTRYRDLILFNLDILHQHLPEAERREKLADAGAVLYRKIIDSRLERDPGRLEAILSAPAVRRALGEEAAGEYDARVETALADCALRQRAREWVDADMLPEEAEKKAAGEAEDGEALLAHYRRFRAERNEKEVLTHVLNARTAWEAIKEGNYRREAIPGWVRWNHPALHELVQSLLDAWLGNGGAASEPDYDWLLRFMIDGDRGAMWEELREEKRVYELVAALGGLESWAFDVVSRKILAKSTPEDATLIADLAAALGAADERLSFEERNVFLSLFYRDRRQKLERMGVSGLLCGERAELVEACLRAVGEEG